MSSRVFAGFVVGLVVLALSGFYFALRPRPIANVTPRPNAAVVTTASAPSTEPREPRLATASSIEAEIARSQHAALQKLLKQHFAGDYKELIEVAVRLRNEGASETAVGEEMFGRFQAIMRSNLKSAAAAQLAVIDRLAANEMSMFRILGTEGSGFCLKVLGKEQSAGIAVPPDNIRRLMQQGTLHRFEAIVDGRSRTVSIDPISNAELDAFQVSLRQDGLTFDDVRTGAFMSKEGDEPGKPCQMVEKLYRSVSRLGDDARRKLYVSLFFLGRDN